MYGNRTVRLAAADIIAAVASVCMAIHISDVLHWLGNFCHRSVALQLRPNLDLRLVLWRNKAPPALGLEFSPTMEMAFFKY